MRLGPPTRLPASTDGFVVDQRPAPAYLRLYESGELGRRVQRALRELASCRVCPRNCQTDRLHAVATRRTPLVPIRVAGTAAKRDVPDHIPKGTACFTGRHARISSAFPHFGEEDCLRGWAGSGTIFFAFCNLRCVFCQNWDTSQAGEGVELRAEELAQVMLELQHKGCHNINFVTPEHVVPQVLEALYLAAEAGLNLPLVYNTSAYDSLSSLALLDGLVDIYMPDFKYWDPAAARRYLKAADYPEVARRVVGEMHRQVGPLTFDRTGLAVRGVLIRHLVMPDSNADSAAIFDFLAKQVSPDTYLNLMDQYYPAGKVEARRYPELTRRPQPKELAEARRSALQAGLWRLDTRWA